MSPFADASDLTIDAEWDNMCDMMHDDPAELPPVKEEVCTVLKEWTSDEESVDVDIMEVDEQIGSNFFSDDLFGYCPSPVSPQEELLTMSMDHHQYHEDKFLTPPLSPEYPALPPLLPSHDEKYRQAFQKLMESMKKSQETRVSLTMKSSKATDAYERRKSVSAVLSSIEKSRCQIEHCFGSQLDIMTTTTTATTE